MSAPGTHGGDRDERVVLVTRPEAQARPLADALAGRGLQVVACPVLRIEPAAVAADLPDLGRYAWLVFTSANAVNHLRELCEAAGVAPALPPQARLAAVGKATAAALGRLGRVPDLVPEVATGEAMAAALVARDLPPGTRVLRLRGDRAPAAIEDALRAAGAEVEPFTVYRTVTVEPPAEALAAITTARVAAVTFASPSALAGLTAALPPDALAVLRAGASAVCIGPVTAGAARDAGWRHVVTAAESTAVALAEAVTGALDSDPPTDPPVDRN
jgi:uroporphyrinogen-III synthase